MLQIIVSVFSLQNGSMNAVSGTGSTSMSDSLMACQPRMLEPSKPSPSSKTPSSRASCGMVKCCHRPGKSMKRRSTARTSFSRISARTSLGVMTGPPVDAALPPTTAPWKGRPHAQQYRERAGRGFARPRSRKQPRAQVLLHLRVLLAEDGAEEAERPHRLVQTFGRLDGAALVPRPG